MGIARFETEKAEAYRWLILAERSYQALYGATSRPIRSKIEAIFRADGVTFEQMTQLNTLLIIWAAIYENDAKDPDRKQEKLADPVATANRKVASENLYNFLLNVLQSLGLDEVQL